MPDARSIGPTLRAFALVVGHWNRIGHALQMVWRRLSHRRLRRGLDAFIEILRFKIRGFLQSIVGIVLGALGKFLGFIEQQLQLLRIDRFALVMFRKKLREPSCERFVFAHQLGEDLDDRLSMFRPFEQLTNRVDHGSCLFFGCRSVCHARKEITLRSLSRGAAYFF